MSEELKACCPKCKSKEHTESDEEYTKNEYFCKSCLLYFIVSTKVPSDTEKKLRARVAELEAKIEQLKIELDDERKNVTTHADEANECGLEIEALNNLLESSRSEVNYLNHELGVLKHRVRQHKSWGKHL